MGWTLGIEGMERRNGNSLGRDRDREGTRDSQRKRNWEAVAVTQTGNDEGSFQGRGSRGRRGRGLGRHHGKPR